MNLILMERCAPSHRLIRQGDGPIGRFKLQFVTNFTRLTLVSLNALQSLSGKGCRFDPNEPSGCFFWSFGQIAGVPRHFIATNNVANTAQAPTRLQRFDSFKKPFVNQITLNLGVHPNKG
jgi:hypothetical protein